MDGEECGSYKEDIVQEFYASYIEALLGSLERRVNPTKYTPLRDVRIRGCQVDISSPAIRRFLHGGSTDAARVPLTQELDYRCDIFKSFHFH